MFKTEQSSGCPIKREDLTQLITGKNYRQRNLPAFVINEARKKLEEIFGYEMKELQRARSSTTNRYSQSFASLRRLVLMETMKDPVLGNLNRHWRRLLCVKYVHKEKVSGPEGMYYMMSLLREPLDEDIN
nr:non-structural maintenance of chromosomes element 3 homolog [Ipomoea batatas]